MTYYPYDKLRNEIVIKNVNILLKLLRITLILQMYPYYYIYNVNTGSILQSHYQIQPLNKYRRRKGDIKRRRKRKLVKWTKGLRNC